MNITELRPQEVFYWFDQLCRIPHGSGNTAAISAFCEDFARERGLRCHRDELGNIVIFKDASPDRTGSAPVMLQGHLDMVCDKAPGCTKDMTVQGIDPVTDGEYVWADGTTLGADDGIAAAYILAILDSSELTHPPIEAVLTVDEEVGLVGASGLDCSILSARRAINIDSEEEGIITVSCAGGVRVTCTVPMTTEQVNIPDPAYIRLSVSGMPGGHSGIDINKNRHNAIKVLGRLLDRLERTADIGICTLKGGAAMNIIPPSSEAVIVCSKDSADGIIAAADSFGKRAKEEYRLTDPDITVTAELCGECGTCTDRQSTKKLIFALLNAPHGVTAMDPEIPGMVKSSLNTATAELTGDVLTICCFVRSNDSYGKQIIVEQLYSYYEYLGGTVSLASDYPAWAYRSDSRLREAAVTAYREMYGEEPQILAIHAGLECGILSSKMDDADFISFGPDIENAHTPMERLGAASAERCYRYLLSLLKNLD